MGLKKIKAASSSSKKSKRFIKMSVNVHDRTQLETVFDYYLLRPGKGEFSPKLVEATTSRTVRIDQSKNKIKFIPLAGSSQTSEMLGYQVDAYFLYPRQFGVNEHTYPKERFYADARPMLRFREPKMGFKTMIGLKPGVMSPLIFLRDYLKGLQSGTNVEAEQNAIDEVRLFGCAYISTYFRGIDRNRRRIHRLINHRDEASSFEISKLCDRMHRMIERADKILREFWILKEEFQSSSDPRAEVIHNEMRIVDEYCYYRLRDGAAYLLQFHERLETHGGCGEIDQLKSTILNILELHDEHARTAGFMMVTPASGMAEKEKFIHRRGELKRHIWEVLFLEIRSVPLFAVQRQVGAMVAAGLAAAWALIAQYLLLRKVNQPQALADGLGLSGLLFLSAGVLAYVVKDRIKEIGRGYFGGGLFRRLPDHTQRIFYPNRSGRPTVVGDVREVARFMRPSELPSEIVRLRSEIPDAEIYGAVGIERVLKYSKSIRLSGKLRILNRYPLRAVHDILRLNIGFYLSKLGEPKRTVEVVTDNGEVETVRFPKVYYLDLVLDYSKLDQNGQKLQTVLDYFRLVLDKNGLQRIERLS